MRKRSTAAPVRSVRARARTRAEAAAGKRGEPAAGAIASSTSTPASGSLVVRVVAPLTFTNTVASALRTSTPSVTTVASCSTRRGGPAAADEESAHRIATRQTEGRGSMEQPFAERIWMKRAASAGIPAASARDR